MNQPTRLRSLEMLSFEQIKTAIDEVGILGNEFMDWLEVAEKAIKELKQASRLLPPDISVIEKLDELNQLISPALELIVQGLKPFAPKFEIQVKTIELAAPRLFERMGRNAVQEVVPELLLWVCEAREGWSLGIDSLEEFEVDLKILAGWAPEAARTFRLIKINLRDLTRIFNRYWFALGDMERALAKAPLASRRGAVGFITGFIMAFMAGFPLVLSREKERNG